MKRNSWHYKLAKMANNDMKIWDDDMSICEYTRKVMFGGILFLFLVALGSIAVGWLGFAIYQIIGMMVGFAEFGPAAGVLLGLIGLIVFGIVWNFLKEKWEAKSRVLLKKDNKSFAAEAYKSYKDKICFRVKFDE